MDGSLARFLALFYVSAGFILSADCSSIRQPSRPHENSNLLDSDSEPDVPSHKRFRRIHSGTEALESEFTFMAQVGRTTEQGRNAKISWVCGGTLITLRTVLTAAHCVAPRKYYYAVRVGNVNTRYMNYGTQQIDVDKIIIHPDYFRSGADDIALVQLKKEVFEWMGHARPLNLRTSYEVENINVYDETTYVTIGFGNTGLFKGPSEKLLKTANMTVMSGNMCRKTYYTNISIFDMPGPEPYENVLCAVDSDIDRATDTCEGDSGGPLLMINGRKKILLGITSRGQACGLGAPGVYTYVLPYLSWIEACVWHQDYERISVFYDYLDNIIGY